MPADFERDVFLSHSSQDKEIVRPLAERLRKDGIRVWFDEWEIRPGDSIPSKIEAGLEQSRVLVLCMSAHAFGSDWTQLESGTFRFRDPVNRDRRFIPLRLDDTAIKGSLGQFLYIDWRPQERDQSYSKLLEACQPEGMPLPQPSSAAAGSNENSSERSHDLRVSISSTRDQNRQLAQIRILNAGPRPILVDSWFVAWNDHSMRTSIICERGVLPVRLQDHERADILVDISEKPVELLQSIGVYDAERRTWHASAENLHAFVYTAKLVESSLRNAHKAT